MKSRIFSTASFLFVALAMIFSLTFSAVAQEVTGTIVGTVKDASGAVVPGAVITITDPQKDNIVVRTITTNDEGVFSAPNLTPGLYEITVEAQNFKKSVNTDIKLDVGARREVNIGLEAGNVAETVTVEADQVSVNLTTPTSSTVINGDQVREIPINNRNFVQLVALAPGVSSNLADQVYVGTTNPNGEANTINLSVNGARSSQNTFTVDGADITDRGSNLTIQAYPSVDSIGEFQVLRSLYPAESGRSGGGQVNVVTKSGTDRFSGSLFEFVRNEKFNANRFFDNQTAPFGRDSSGRALRTPFRYNNFGGTIGGPVYFFNFGEGGSNQGMFRKYEKTYFFFSEEVRRDVRYPTLSSTVPDANLRAGVFTVPICLQATTTCTTILPAGTPLSSVRTINPLAQQYLQYIYNKLPLPNVGQFGLSFPAQGISNFRQEIFKLDTSFTSKFSAYYRFENDVIPTIDVNALFSSGSGLPGVSTTQTDSPGRTHTFQGTYLISPSLIAVGRYTYGFGAILSNNKGLLALANSPIAPPLPFANQRDRVPTISGNGFSALQSFGPYDNFSWKQNFSGDLTWIKGSHTLKFGTIASLYRKNENALAGNNEGIYTAFNTPGATSAVIATGGSTVQQQFANFLLGTNATLTQAHFDYTADLRQKTFESYVQDEWRFRPNLTIYAGVRYSFFGSPWDKNNRLTNFLPELYNPAVAPLVTGAGNRVVGSGNFCNGIIVNAQNFQTAPNGCVPTVSPFGKYVIDAPKKDFAPRIGLAWDPFGKGMTSIRTGYGIYHEQVLNGTFEQNIGINLPYQETCQVVGINIANPVPSGNCPLVASTASLSVRAIQADWKTPYMQHWSLDWQQQLDSKTIFTIGYYGSKGTNLIGAFEANEIPAGYAISRGATGCATGASTTPTVACQVAGAGFFSSAAEAILDQLRPYRGYRSITIIQPRYNSNYHSLQISAQRRFSGASQINMAYTWSKNLTDNQTDRSTAPQNSFDIHSDYGRATLDRRHIFTMNYIYEIPYFTKQEGFIGKVLGGWQASGIVVFNTGLPFTVTTSNYDPAGLGFIPAAIAGGRPNITCNPNQGGAGTQQQFFNTACFTLNPLTTATNLSNTPGSSPRGIIEGPNLFRVDFKMTKNIRFGERINLQLFGEAFNILNRTNFNTLSLNVTAANFGQVLTTRDPRNLQFGFKLNF
ncbi:MAG TPA: carboxypeptidase regulatory-like domain-containing protein [Pyrinomonadaceae bacterium]